MSSSRHGRPGTLSKAVIAVLVIVVLGTSAVAVLADSVLAVRLAVAGALASALLVGTTYDAALRAVRADVAHERAIQARIAGELTTLRISNERALASLQSTVDALTAQTNSLRTPPVARRHSAEPSRASHARSRAVDMWEDTSDVPTVVGLAARRETRDQAADEAAKSETTSKAGRSTRSAGSAGSVGSA